MRLSARTQDWRFLPMGERRRAPRLGNGRETASSEKSQHQHSGGPATPSRSLNPLHDVPACPLCGCVDRRHAVPARPNLYSEKLAQSLGCSESTLLAKVANVECAQCKLVYKRQWFDPEVLRRVFAQLVPLHPRGWDAVSERFSLASFLHELDELKQAVTRADQSEINRLTRALKSVIDSMINLPDHDARRRLMSAVEEHDFQLLRTQQDLLKLGFERPWPFKRFAGLADEGLWAWMSERGGLIREYGEVGCPLWGYLPRVRNGSEVNAYYIVRAEPNFWGAACQHNARHCLQHLLAPGAVQQRPWSLDIDPKLDLLAAYQYIDHLENPREFFREGFTQAHRIVVVLGNPDRGVAVQHFTGWNPYTMKHLGEYLGATLHTGFEPIESAGNAVYMLCR